MPQPIAAPTITAEMNSLPARIPNDIAAPVEFGRRRGLFGRWRRRRRPPSLEVASQFFQPGVERGVLVVVSRIGGHG